jgi:sec-independent protein translocase protein TatA
MSYRPVEIVLNKNEDIFMAGLSIWHVVIFAIVVILLFGTSKLKNLGKDVGGAVKDFKKSIKDDEVTTSALNEPRTIEHQGNPADVNSTAKTHSG